MLLLALDSIDDLNEQIPDSNEDIVAASAVVELLIPDGEINSDLIPFDVIKDEIAKLQQDKEELEDIKKASEGDGDGDRRQEPRPGARVAQVRQGSDRAREGGARRRGLPRGRHQVRRRGDSGAQARARAEAQEHRLVRRLRPVRHDARHEQLEAGGQVERDHRRSEPAVERDV